MRREKTETKSETVLLPGPNQLILLRELQKEICAEINSLDVGALAVPCLPVCLRSAGIKDLKDKITRTETAGVRSDADTVFLEVGMTVNGEECDGKIALVRTEQCGGGVSGVAVPLKDRAVSQRLRKISPFRIAEMETEESELGREWRVLRERWGKIT